MIRLEKTNGPECPNCGCTDSVQVDEIVTMPRLVAEVRQCTACGRKFNRATDEEVVWYHRLRCPVCESASVRVTGTRGKMRYHKCNDCEVNFRSVEV